MDSLPAVEIYMCGHPYLVETVYGTNVRAGRPTLTTTHIPLTNISEALNPSKAKQTFRAAGCPLSPCRDYDYKGLRDIAAQSTYDSSHEAMIANLQHCIESLSAYSKDLFQHYLIDDSSIMFLILDIAGEQLAELIFYEPNERRWRFNLPELNDSAVMFLRCVSLRRNECPRAHFDLAFEAACNVYEVLLQKCEKLTEFVTIVKRIEAEFHVHGLILPDSLIWRQIQSEQCKEIVFRCLEASNFDFTLSSVETPFFPLLYNSSNDNAEDDTSMSETPRANASTDNAEVDMAMSDTPHVVASNDSTHTPQDDYALSSCGSDSAVDCALPSCDASSAEDYALSTRASSPADNFALTPTIGEMALAFSYTSTPVEMYAPQAEAVPQNARQNSETRSIRSRRSLTRIDTACVAQQSADRPVLLYRLP
ncbi:hypothetical protein MRB53_037626 [Persea americana]|nr:hypothetical protein MRB53_037626 [Persea americana]